MKSMLKQFGLFLMSVLLGIGGTFAKDTERTSALSLSVVSQESLNWDFVLDLGNIDGKTEADIEMDVREFIESNITMLSAELNCKVSVTGKVSLGVASVNITVEVSGPCSQVRANGTKIANQVLNEVRRVLQP